MMDKFIANHTNALARTLVVLLILWYAVGLLVIDWINPVVFIAIWVPLGILGSVFSSKW